MSDQQEVQMFSEWLAGFKRGSVDAELTAILREVTTAAKAVNKKGTLQVSFTIDPSDDRIVTVKESVKATVPEATRTKQIYFTTDEGDLVRNDPAADPLPFPETTNKGTNNE